jgi:lipoprotein-anchoring transpeptidase ErfK/SrfK
VTLCAPAAAHAASTAPQTTSLSNETTVTQWTIAAGKGAIRAKPSTTGRTVARLKLWTSDGFPEVYIALTQKVVHGRIWYELRLPGRPNGRTGWVRDNEVDVLNTVHTQIVIDRAAHTLTLNRNGQQIFQTPVGVGKASTPTPSGHFWITEKFSVHNNPVYGPFAMGTSAYSHLTDWPGGGVIGIHGTNEPSLVPGNPSHGCIRVHNSAIRRLAKLVPVGTPVLIV